MQTGAKPQKNTAYVTDGHDRAIVSTRQSTTSPVGREFPMDGAEGQDIYHSCLLNHREDSSLPIDWNDKLGLYHFDDRFRSKSRCLKLRPSARFGINPVCWFAIVKPTVRLGLFIRETKKQMKHQRKMK